MNMKQSVKTRKKPRFFFLSYFKHKTEFNERIPDQILFYFKKKGLYAVFWSQMLYFKLKMNLEKLKCFRINICTKFYFERVKLDVEMPKSNITNV